MNNAIHELGNVVMLKGWVQLIFRYKFIVNYEYDRKMYGDREKLATKHGDIL